MSDTPPPMGPEGGMPQQPNYPGQGGPQQPGYPPGPGGLPPGPPPSNSPLSATWLMNNEPAPPGWQPKQKVVAGILGILVGSLGVHSFYLGNTKKGLIQLVATFVTCGIASLWGFIEGILILIGNENTRTDAYGYPMTE
jgi:TM2 domain-containing membrane protein YozV